MTTLCDSLFAPLPGAVGVNLPIVLIVTVSRGMERIKVRDFHNLIGRKGKSGCIPKAASCLPIR